MQAENLDDLDDMAFLDAQVEKVQNSHGRQVAGSGKSYRTIVNGILNFNLNIFCTLEVLFFKFDLNYL